MQLGYSCFRGSKVSGDFESLDMCALWKDGVFKRPRFCNSLIYNLCSWVLRVSWAESPSEEALLTTILQESGDQTACEQSPTSEINLRTFYRNTKLKISSDYRFRGLAYPVLRCALLSLAAVNLALGVRCSPPSSVPRTRWACPRQGGYFSSVTPSNHDDQLLSPL